VKVLIPYDGSEYSEAIFEDLAIAGLPTDSEITLFYVVESEPSRSDAEAIKKFEHAIQQGELLIESTVQWFRNRYPYFKFEGLCGMGTPSTEILLLAESSKCDLIILGSHGKRGLFRMFLGSVSLQVLKEARCSVRIVRRREGTPPTEKILLALDGSSYSEKALQEVIQRSWPPGTSIHAVHIDELLLITELHGLKGEEAAPYLQESKEIYQLMQHAEAELKKCNFAISSALKIGNPKYAILTEAQEWHATQIFLGAKGKSKLERLLVGSVSQAVALRAAITTEIVR